MLGQNTLGKILGPSDDPTSRALRYLVMIVGLVALYFVAAQIGLLLRVQYGDLSPLWPPSGIALALLWRFGLHWWPIIVIGEFAVAISLGQHYYSGLIGGAAQSLEAIAAVYALNRFGVSRDLRRPTDVCLFILFGTLLPPLISATIGVCALHFLSGEISSADFASAWSTWWLGDAMGILIVAPFIVQWSRWPFANSREFYGWLGTMVLLLAAGGSIVALERAHYASLFFLLLPFMIVAAAHFGAVGATSTAVIMAALVLGMRVDGPLNDWQTAIKLAFIGVTAFAGYLIAAAVSGQRFARQQLAREQERAVLTLESVSNGVIAVDSHGLTEYVNPAAERITGWLNTQTRRTPIAQLFATTQSQTIEGEMQTLLKTKSGAFVPIESMVTRATRPNNIEAGQVITFRDVGAAQRLQQELSFQANHDTLTGLHNRRAFERELREMTEVGKTNAPCALLYLDLDQFKVLNDTCGHDAGDQLLAQLGKVLKDMIAPPDLFARTGGDEFAVLLRNRTDQQAMTVAESLRKAILDFRFILRELSFSVGVSIGIAPFVAGKDVAGDVLSRADVACYRAKEEGRNRIFVYRIGDTEMLERHSELERASELRRALQESRFCLHWQRIDSLATADASKPIFYEVLLRLEENGETLLPAQFMRAAERFGLISSLDRWVIEDVFRRLDRSHNLLIGINLDSTTLDDPTFHDFVVQTMQKSSAAAAQICFEISEKATVNRLTRVVETIERLRAIGFRFALDDFGSGVASFGYLEQLPVDFVKIDGRFVQGLHQGESNLIVVEALTKLAAVKKIGCVAEWVETGEVLSHLQRLGIGYAQGFYLHRPEPINCAML